MIVGSDPVTKSNAVVCDQLQTIVLARTLHRLPNRNLADDRDVVTALAQLAGWPSA